MNKELIHIHDRVTGCTLRQDWSGLVFELVYNRSTDQDMAIVILDKAILTPISGEPITQICVPLNYNRLSRHRRPKEQ